MSVEKVKKYLEKFDANDRVIELEESSATVELAANAIGCKPAMIAKSVSLKQYDKAIIIVVAGDAKISNKKYKDYFKTKAKMLKIDEVEDITGFVVGGVCPFTDNEDLKIYLDRSLERFEYVYPACGSVNSMIKLTIKELEAFTVYVDWIDVCDLI